MQMMKPGYILLYRLTTRDHRKVWEMLYVNDEAMLYSAIPVDESQHAWETFYVNDQSSLYSAIPVDEPRPSGGMGDVLCK